jgi:hypothetical protein
MVSSQGVISATLNGVLKGCTVSKYNSGDGILDRHFLSRAGIHESTISLRFPGIILRFPMLDAFTFVLAFLKNCYSEQTLLHIEEYNRSYFRLITPFFPIPSELCGRNFGRLAPKTFYLARG